jgi:hypothetical protein
MDMVDVVRRGDDADGDDRADESTLLMQWTLK